MCEALYNGGELHAAVLSESRGPIVQVRAKNRALHGRDGYAGNDFSCRAFNSLQSSKHPCTASLAFSGVIGL